MSTSSMTIRHLVEKLGKYDSTMKVKIVWKSPHYPGVHGHVKFNKIQISHEKKELQFAYDPNQPLYVRNEDITLGVLLSQILRMQNEQGEVSEYLVCKCEIGPEIPAVNREITMYLKNIQLKSEIDSRSFHYDGIDDTIFLEFSE